MPKLKKDTVVVELENGQVFHVDCMTKEAWTISQVTVEWSEEELKDETRDRLICDICGKEIS